MNIVDVDVCDDVHHLSAEEIVTTIDREAQARYGLTAAEFVAQVRANKFDECGGAADLVGLARLLGPAHPLGLGV